MSSIFNGNIKISLFGESHGKAIGAVLDNIPAGEKIDFNEILAQMSRRSPGVNSCSTQRREDDYPEILSGILNEYTTGAPIAAIIKNKDVISKDYEDLKDIPRPGHADFPAAVKYNGFNDFRGGGHFSGRLTAALTFAGAVCRQIVEKRGIKIGAHVLSVGEIKDENFDETNIQDSLISKLNSSSFSVINTKQKIKMEQKILEVKNQNDSIGGSIECAITGFPVGLGEPIFGGVESLISALVFSIPAIKGIEFGAGFKTMYLNGSENNDEFILKDGKIATKTNNHGGILGGLTSSMPVIFKVSVKSTPSIALEQTSINMATKEMAKIQVKGRHDSCIVPRVVPVVEAIAAIAALDLMIGGQKL